uniref:Uncharacterized protein n=1 Tax=Aegilops tauschii subsp. strangulata TaxID=200361 RepID=A0A452XGB2_AEGTS
SPCPAGQPRAAEGSPVLPFSFLESWLTASSAGCCPGEAAITLFVQSRSRGEEQPRRPAPSPIPPRQLARKAKEG